MQNNVTIIPAKTGGDLLDAGLKTGGTVYLAWDMPARRLFVVQWDRLHWLCSCGRVACTHKRAANDYVFTHSINAKEA